MPNYTVKPRVCSTQKQMKRKEKCSEGKYGEAPTTSHFSYTTNVPAVYSFQVNIF